MSVRTLLLITSIALLNCACQQAAWKAGANADDWKRDEQACRTQSHDDENATTQCLRDKGWSIAKPETDAQETTDARNSSAPVSADASAPLTEPVRKITNAPTAPADPLQKQAIQTWWKAGAQAADFNADANTCQQQLGDQHTPDYAQHLFTRAMISCLRNHGWSAGRDPVYTPLR